MEPFLKLYVRAINAEFPRRPSPQSSAVMEEWKHMCGQGGWHNGWGRGSGINSTRDLLLAGTSHDKVLGILKYWRTRNEGNDQFVIYDSFTGGVFQGNGELVRISKLVLDGSESPDEFNKLHGLLREYYGI
jgi:hypothetical protein